MIEPDADPFTVSVLFNPRNSLGNPRLDFKQYKNPLIQYTVNTAQYHDPFCVAGYVLPDGP